MSHCRWVVISEDSFKELSRHKEDRTSDKFESVEEPLGSQPEVQVPKDPDPSEPQDPSGTQEPDPSRPQEPSGPQEPDPSGTQEPDPSDHQEPEVQESESPNTKTLKEWTDQLPPSFRSSGLALLKLIYGNEGFSVASDGSISTSGNLLKGYTIDEFLRTTCIPYHRGHIPLVLQQWLRERKITKFNNPMAQVRNPWKPLYSWKNSTMAKPRGRSEVQKRSTMKPKRKVTLK